MPHRDVRKWVKQAQRQGWELLGLGESAPSFRAGRKSSSGGRHQKIFPPDGRPPIALPGGPDGRGLRNLRAEFRRAGIDV